MLGKLAKFVIPCQDAKAYARSVLAPTRMGDMAMLPCHKSPAKFALANACDGASGGCLLPEANAWPHKWEGGGSSKMVGMTMTMTLTDPGSMIWFSWPWPTLDYDCPITSQATF